MIFLNQILAATRQVFQYFEHCRLASEPIFYGRRQRKVGDRRVDNYAIEHFEFSSLQTGTDLELRYGHGGECTFFI